LEDQVPTAEFDPDQLERLMVAAFELLGKPEGQAATKRATSQISAWSWGAWTRTASLRDEVLQMTDA
jgi:hypothetical protein